MGIGVRDRRRGWLFAASADGVIRLDELVLVDWRLRPPARLGWYPVSLCFCRCMALVMPSALWWTGREWSYDRRMTTPSSCPSVFYLPVPCATDRLARRIAWAFEDGAGSIEGGADADEG